MVRDAGTSASRPKSPNAPPPHPARLAAAGLFWYISAMPLSLAPTLAVHWHCWRPDGPALLESLGRVQDLGLTANLHLHESAHAPLDPEIRQALPPGVAIHPSSYRNRRTRADLQAVLDAYAATAASPSSAGLGPSPTHILRLDCDTLLISHARILDALDADADAVGWAWPGCGLAGCCQLLSTRVIPPLRRLAHDPADPILLGIPPRTGDDVALAYLLDRLYGPAATTRHWWSPDRGYAASYRYGLDGRDLAYYLRSYDLITCGRRDLLTGPPSSRRDAVRQTLALARSLLPPARTGFAVPMHSPCRSVANF